MEETVRLAGAALSRAASEVLPAVRAHDEGRVRRVADGVLGITGLPQAKADEVLRLGRRARALVLGLKHGEVQAIALDDIAEAAVGTSARATGEAASIPVGEALLGRVIDPMGRPLDGRALRGGLQLVPLERKAPQIHERASVHRPLLTGILAVDAMFPIGRGQRELLLGEEGTGKTALALDVMLRQKDTDITSIYVAIGRRRSELWRLVDSLKQGAGRWVVVAAPDDHSPGLRYLAPYAGCAVAEYFTYRGGDSLVVYDDLTAHAVAWRELSLLLQRPPGREAYPGDIFYLHARLLERAAQLSGELGGGSLSALPIALLEGGRLTAYVPTNLISITDGQLIFSQTLFASGQKPAIDVGLSVSRVGAKAQPQALRSLAGQLRLDYASFLELEGYARLGTSMEPQTLRRIELGRRLRVMLRARRLAPLSVFDQVVGLTLAADEQALLSLPPARLDAIVPQLVERARSQLPDVALRVDRDGVLPEPDRDRLARLVSELCGEHRARSHAG